MNTEAPSKEALRPVERTWGSAGVCSCADLRGRSWLHRKARGSKYLNNEYLAQAILIGPVIQKSQVVTRWYLDPWGKRPHIPYRAPGIQVILVLGHQVYHRTDDGPSGAPGHYNLRTKQRIKLVPYTMSDSNPNIWYLYTDDEPF